MSKVMWSCPLAAPPDVASTARTPQPPRCAAAALAATEFVATGEANAFHRPGGASQVKSVPDSRSSAKLVASTVTACVAGPTPASQAAVSVAVPGAPSR